MFFLWLTLTVILILLFFASMSIKLEFENFVINLPKEHISLNGQKGKVSLKIYLFKKIKIFSKNLSKIKNEKLKFKQIKDLVLKFKNNRKTSKLKITNLIKKLNISFEKVNLEMAVGFENAAITALAVGSLYTILENIFTRNIEDFQKCDIKPVYNRNMLWLKFDGIFKIDVWNIISTMLKHN